MGYWLLVLMALAGVGAVLLLELTLKDTPVTNALRTWQSFLGASLGLLAIAFSVPLTATENRAQQVEERSIRGRQVALALHAEIMPLARQIHKAAKSAGMGSKVAREDFDRVEAMNIGKVTLTCPGGRDILGSVRPLGVFESNRNHLGQLPGALAYHFVRFHAQWRELTEAIERLPSTVDCSKGARSDLDMIEARANIILYDLIAINTEMKQAGFLMKEAPEF